MLGLLFVLFSLPLSSAFIGESRVTAKGLDEYGLALVPPTSSDFPRLLQRAVGRNPSRELEAVLPYSVLLVNTSKKRVVFYSVRWASTSSKGIAVQDDRMYYNLATLRGGYAVDPGAVWLVSVVDAVNKPLKSDSEKEFAQKFHQSRMDLQFLQQSNVTISLDVAIFANGEVVGPDRSGSMEQAQARLDSAHDVYAGFEEREARHRSIQPFVSWLRELTNTPQALGYANTSKWYRYHKQRLAEDLVSVYEQGGEAALRDRVQRTCRVNIQLHR